MQCSCEWNGDKVVSCCRAHQVVVERAWNTEREACAKLMTDYARKERDEKRVTAFADAADAIRARKN